MHRGKVIMVKGNEPLDDNNSIRVRKDFIMDRNLTCAAKVLHMYMQVKAANGEDFDEAQAVQDLFTARG